METVEKKFRSLYVDVPIQVPSTVADFDANAKAEGRCLAEAINNVVYRGVLADFRDLLIHGREADEKAGVAAVEGLEAITGIARKTTKKTVGKREVEVWDETEGEYVARVIAARGWDKENPTELQNIADAVAKYLVFDASAAPATTKGPKKLPSDYLEAATRIITKGSWDKYSRFGLVQSGDTAKDAEALGWKIREEVLAKQRAATLAYE